MKDNTKLAAFHKSNLKQLFQSCFTDETCYYYQLHLGEWSGAALDLDLGSGLWATARHGEGVSSTLYHVLDTH